MKLFNINYAAAAARGFSGIASPCVSCSDTEVGDRAGSGAGSGAGISLFKNSFFFSVYISSRFGEFNPLLQTS